MMRSTTTAAVAPQAMPAHGSNSLLDFLDIELTERCNLICKHCYIRRALGDRKALATEMDTRQVCAILEEAVSLGCKGVRFTGGELLIRKDFIEIYLFACSIGLNVSISTNITLITDEIANVFSKNPPEVISTSIYGWDKNSYDSVVQVPGSFEKFVAGVRKLRKRGLKLQMKYPPLKELVDNSEKIRNLAVKLDVLDPLPYTWELTLHARNHKHACERIRVLRLDPEEAAKQRLKEPDVALHDLQVIRYDRESSQFNSKLFVCPAAKKRLTIDAYGWLQVCLEMRHPDTIYDLNTGNLLEAITQHLPKISNMCITNPEFLNRCGRCLLRPACPQCPACSWTEYGTLDTPVEYHCEVMHAEARLLGLLKEGEKGWE